jgi:cytochrome P450
LDSARKRFGHVWTLRLMGDTTIVLVSDPALVEQIFTADYAVLYGEARIITPLVGERSALVVNEDEHRTLRGLLRPPFHADHVRRYREVMVSHAEQEVATWPLNQSMALLPRLDTITLGVIVTVVFGVTDVARSRELFTRLRKLLAFRDKPFAVIRMQAAYMSGRKPPQAFLDLRNPVDALIFEELERARQDPRLEGRDDVLALLVKAHKDDGSPLTDRELRDQLITLLVQGHASTASGTAWVFERLVRHPDALERLSAEAQTDNEDYLDAVVNETLRVRPPLPNPMRRVNGDRYQLGEWELDPGIMISANAYILHRRGDIYPDPDRFRPERFLDQEPGTYTWIPFGGGPRHCPGRTFATTEIKAVVRTLLRHARFAAAEHRDERIRRRGVGFSPASGARVVVKERVTAAAAPVRG